MTITLGTHNLWDYAGEPTPFADVLLFTEAVPSRVRALLEPEGYVVAPCRWQRDLVIAWRKGTFVPAGRGRYRLAHPGIPLVTPRRGTYWIVGRVRGVPAALVVEHRINAAFPPFKRGERHYRSRMWRRHTRLTLRVIERLKSRGLRVLAGGDINTPPARAAYAGVLHEAGSGYDRLGSTTTITDAEYLSRVGSDHRRLRALVGLGRSSR